METEVVMRIATKAEVEQLVRDVVAEIAENQKPQKHRKSEAEEARGKEVKRLKHWLSVIRDHCAEVPNNPYAGAIKNICERALRGDEA